MIKSLASHNIVIITSSCRVYTIQHYTYDNMALRRMLQAGNLPNEHNSAK